MIECNIGDLLKNRAGRKAIIVDVVSDGVFFTRQLKEGQSKFDDSGYYIHDEVWHNADGSAKNGKKDHDIIGKWEEPKTVSDLRSVIDKIKNMPDKELRVLAKERLYWSDTGLLPKNSKLREMAHMINEHERMCLLSTILEKEVFRRFAYNRNE